MKKHRNLKKRLREGAIRRAPRDIYMAEEWASLEDTLSLEEKRLVREGEAQLKRGQYVRWEGLKNI
jgi:hypothetical protein